MTYRTPQEWADFLGMKVACFSSGEIYEYYAFDRSYFPFSIKWLEVLPQAKLMTPQTFYDRFRMNMTHSLADHKYNAVFIPTVDGDIRLLRKVGDERYFENGRLEPFNSFFKIPLGQLERWDKNIYVPVDDTIIPVITDSVPYPYQDVTTKL